MRFTRGIALLSVVLMAGCYVDDEIEPDFGGGAGGGGGETDGSLPDACDEGAVEACFVEGECRGERVCTNGVFGECTAPAEVCDGRDNDCDGEADEGYAGLGDACQAGEGACVDRGRIVCTEDGTDVVCDATPGDGTTDVCDAIDNDCDGTVDEEATLGEACDTGRLGVCAAGIIGCTDGDARCAPSTDASDEICDGLDNDCDGRVDEDGLGGLLAEPCYEGPEGTDGVGICASGVRLCVDGAFDACTGAVTPLEEICDGLDNDCDGTVDTDECGCVPGEARACYSGPEGTEGIGACAPGRQVCGADGTFGACRGEVTPTAEACDGVDNDCDGAVDDVPGAGQPCTDGVGACAVDGSRVCDLESGRLVCDAVAGAPVDEVCDGIDNDCDGVVDDVEGVGELCTIGEGACFDRGAQRCIDGALACDAVEGEPGAETCNQIDDDCNGEVDDVPGLDEHCEIGLGICRSTALTKCDYQTGAVFCPATEQDPEPADYCGNRVDDDCDGEVDEEGCAIRCAGDDDCPGGYCNGRVCVACLADADCGDGDICVDGACVAPLDSDGDGIADVVDVDDDNDGIPDASECFGALDGQTSVINGGFEVPPVAPGANRQTPEADVPGWETTEGPGSIEMWGTGFLGVPAAVGGAFAEINAFEADGALYQDIATIPGTIFTWSFYHRGRLGEDELELRAGSPDATVTITTAATGNQAWRRYTGTYVVPDGQMLTRFEFRSIRSTGGAGLGNFVDGVEFLPSCPADADADGDGIPNALDLDSDDDGIPDAEEAGHDQPHTDGRVDGPVGGNGLVDALETVPDSGIIDYELRDSDGDGIYDFLDPDGGGVVCPDGGAPGACPPGFETTPDGLGCERLTQEPAQLNGELLGVCPVGPVAGWGPGGVLLPGGTSFDGGFFGEGADGSRLNTVGVWACEGGQAGQSPIDEPIGFARCFQVDEPGEYVLGIGVDDDAVASIDGEVVFERANAYTQWHLVPTVLSAGTHIITLEGINTGGPGGMGAEIYGPFPAGSTDTDDELMALDYANNVIFSSRDQLGGVFDTGLTNGYSCPEGLALDLCGAEAQCTAFERLDACALAPCGNGALDDGETCDDGNRQNGDGCDSTCQVEDGYLCDDPGLGPCAPDQAVETIDLVPGDNLPAVGGQGGSPFADSCPIGEVIVGFDYRIGNSFGGNTYIERSRAQCARLDLVAGEARLTLTGVTPERGGPPASGVPPGFTHEVRCPEGELVRGYTGYGDAYVSGVALLCSTLAVEAGGVVLGAPVEQPPVGRTDDDLGTFTCPDAHVVGANSGRHGFIIDQFTMRCDAIVEACRTNSVCETDGEICDDQLDNDDDGDIDCRDADCDGAAACEGACFSDDDCLDGEICTDGFCAQSDDRDGDGVPDVRDLDDDNDGILDTDECTPGLGAVINSSFEAPVIADGAFLYIQPQDQGGAFGWTTNVPDQPVEIQGRGHATAPEAALGRQYGEANAAVVGGFYQDVATVPGHTYEWTMYHRGRDGVDSLQVRFGAPGPVETLTPIVTAVTDNDAWILYSGTYTVPAGQEVTRLSFATIFAAGGASRGNFIDGFTFTPVCDLDTDGDGLVNSRDLDSDADGIPDAEEAGHDQPHTNGVVDGPVGGNGVPDAVETLPDSSDVAYTLRETDGDGIFDFLDDDQGAGPAEICDNDADDDDDGAVDCEDRDCNLDPACAVTRTVYFTAPDDATFDRVPGVPTRLYTIDGAGNLQLLGDILLDGEPIAVSAIALSPDGTLVGFQHRRNPFGSRLIIIDPDTATAVAAGEYLEAFFDGAAYAPDGTLYVTDDDSKQVRIYDDGLGAAVLDYPVPFLGADIAIDLDGSCYLTGVGPDFTQYELYACDLEAGTTESLGVYVNNPGFDRDGATTIPAMAFAYDPATCASRLYAFDSLSVDELGYLDVSADPPTMNHIASTDINFAYYLTPDMAGFPSVANAPDCDGPVELCDDGVDNDDDGDVDCGDIDCRDDAACAIESTFYFTTPSQAGTPEPVAPTRLYTLNSAGDLLLLGDVTLDGIPAIVTALALSPTGELYGFERHSDLPESRLIAIDRETGTAVPVDDFIAGEIMGAGFGPDGRLWVLDDTTQQLAEYIDGALAPSLDLPVQFDGGDIAFDATGACYLTGAALGGVGALDLYRCDPDAGTLESIGALATEGFIDAEGAVHVTAIAFSYDDVTCASTLYALDGLAIDELGTIDVGADPPLMSQVASTGVNYSWFTTPDGAGFPSVVNSPACAGRVEICDNDQDDDGNGAIDCDDIACQGVPACPIGLPDFEVTVRGFDMLPSSARVPVGTTVRWTNEDGARHTVTSGAPGDADAGAIFDGDLPGNGGTFAFTFDAPGEYPYYCRPHAGSMFGYSIIVE